MTFKLWLRKVFGSRKQVARGSHRGNSRPAWRYRFVARVEFLEDRLAPAIITVTNATDDVVSGNGVGGSCKQPACCIAVRYRLLPGQQPLAATMLRVDRNG